MEKSEQPGAQSPDKSVEVTEPIADLAEFNDVRARALVGVIKLNVEVDEYGEEGALKELLVEVIDSISVDTLREIAQLPDGKNKQSSASDRSELRELAEAELEKRRENSEGVEG